MADNGLTWEDLSNMTWEDLEKLNITWNDLILSRAKLLEKIKNQDAPIPPSIYEKFKKICESAPEELKSQLSVKNSVKKIGGAIILCLELLEHSEWIAEHTQEFMKIVESILECFS